MKVVIQLDTLNEVLSYLGKRPYIEVFELIKKIEQTSTVIQDQDQEKDASS